MSSSKPSLYLISVLLFMLILPVSSVAFEYFRHTADLGWLLIGKWFVFWAIGVRVFIAGVRQVTKPEFTAKEIFDLEGTESLVIIRELGLSNICVGLLAIISLFKPGWCGAAAFTGGLYFGLAGLLHVIKKPVSKNEVIAMVSDLYIFVIMLLYLVFTRIY
ncbi:MAG: hypothetical protein JWO06_577 [Bacteroidota bacterium]|nr:hypothetical protein [Bacteroidota bacterium]